jgi:hypothetical protein
MRHYCTGYAWQSSWASSDYSSIVTPYWWFKKSTKEWDINKDTMDAYVTEIRKLENKFLELEIHHVIHDNNVGMDVLSKLGSDRANVPPGVFVHELHHPSIRAPDSNCSGFQGTRLRGLDDRGRLEGGLHQ